MGRVKSDIYIFAIIYEPYVKERLIKIKKNASRWETTSKIERWTFVASNIFEVMELIYQSPLLNKDRHQVHSIECRHRSRETGVYTTTTSHFKGRKT